MINVQSQQNSASSSSTARPRVVQAYDYTDKQGVLLYQNVRYEPKDFRLRRSDGNGGWIWSLDGVDRILYRFPELLKATLQDWVCLTEGEKDTETLRVLGFPATTSGSSSSWRPEFAKFFEGRLVAVFAHNDKVGRRYATTVAKSLQGIAAEVRIVEPDGLDESGDITDWCDQHDSLEPAALAARIQAMIDEAKPFRAASDEQELTIRPRYVFLRDVEPEEVRWLWQDRIPAAMLSLLIGLEGTGKTFVALDMAARITTGRAWPDADIDHLAPTVGNVVFLTSEDHLSYTVRPRLDAMGADAGRVVALQGVTSTKGEDEPFNVIEHLPALEDMVRTVGDVRLAIVDPITGFLGKTDQNANADVRRALSRFCAIAEEYGCAVLGISHLSKDSSKRAIHRTLGSVAFSASARAVWLVQRDRDDESRRLLVPVKMNLAPKPSSLAFTIQGQAVAWEDGQFDYNADDVLAEPKGETPIDQAEQFLREFLAGGRVQAKEVYEAAKLEKIASTTLKRAKAKLGVKSDKIGMSAGSTWFWRLPDAT